MSAPDSSSSAWYVDSHCHLNHEQFAGDLEQAVSRAAAENVAIMVVVGFDIASSERAVELAEWYPEVYAAVAVHPHDSRSFGDAAESRIRELAQNPRVAAIGEIGLDFHYDYSPKEAQYEAFERQLRIAEETDLPVIIHCREAYTETLSVLEGGLNREAGGVMHCWAGSAGDASRALALGLYLGFGGTITFKNADVVREVLSATPEDRILLETDAPYLAPVPHRGKRNEPSYIPLIARAAAETLGAHPFQLAAAATANTLRLFQRISR
jgi:TatD DNase family protein